MIDYGDEHELRMKKACSEAMFGIPCRCNMYRPKETPEPGMENNGICDFFTVREVKTGPRGGRSRVYTTMPLRNLAACPRRIHSVRAAPHA